MATVMDDAIATILMDERASVWLDGQPIADVPEAQGWKLMVTGRPPRAYLAMRRPDGGWNQIPVEMELRYSAAGGWVMRFTSFGTILSRIPTAATA